MILGCDAAGVLDDGSEVVVHAVIGDPEAGGGDETLDPRRTLLSELHPGTLAEQVLVPSRNVVREAGLDELGRGGVGPHRVADGLPHAHHPLRARAGRAPCWCRGRGAAWRRPRSCWPRPWVTRCSARSRDADKRARALAVGADIAVASGERLPEKVDVVIETVGAATWEHSLRALRPGGRIVVSGATSGMNPPAALNRVYFLQLSVVGSTMGTRDELVEMLALIERSGIRPMVSDVRPLNDARASFELLERGDVFGKLVLTV